MKSVPKKIVITGASLCGKSALIEHLKNRHTEKAKFIDEIASVVIGSGYKELALRFPGSIWNTEMQETITVSQRNIEDAVFKAAEKDGDKVVIMDRSILDAAGYGVDVETLEGFSNLTKKQILSRYDQIIMLSSIGNKDKDLYNKHLHENPSRIHGCEENLEIEKKIEAVWSEHPNFIKLPVYNSAEELFGKVEALLSDSLNREVEFKYFVEFNPESRHLLYEHEKRSSLITQIYLSKDPEIRVRREQSRYRDKTTMTIKSQKLPTRDEYDFPIPSVVFEKMQHDYPSVKKERYTLKEGQYTISIDYYLTGERVVEVEVPDESLFDDGYFRGIFNQRFTGFAKLGSPDTTGELKAFAIAEKHHNE